MLTRAWRRAIAAAIVAAAAACSAPANPPEPAATPAPAPPATAGESTIAADLPVLHASLTSGARPAAVARTAYEFAARHPEVLGYVPCFCGCERRGHKGNADCFVAARDKNGRVSAWEEHGLFCEICIDLAIEAKTLHDAGVSTADIRDRIDREYGAAGSHTATPLPPKGGSRG